MAAIKSGSELHERCTNLLRSALDPQARPEGDFQSWFRKEVRDLFSDAETAHRRGYFPKDTFHYTNFFKARTPSVTDSPKAVFAALESLVESAHRALIIEAKDAFQKDAVVRGLW